MRPPLRLFDTWERKTREFRPLSPGKAGLYACGPTVYNYAHIGNLRTYVFEDILRRVLQFNGFEVRHVVNITDVGHLTSDADTGEDKMEVGARRTGKTAWEIADYYTAAFQQDLKDLNILSPHIWCRATDHIQDQIDFVRDLEEKGFTYRTADGIYFDSRKLDDYGYLARLDIDGLRAGARVEQGGRRFVTDFALWKFSRPDEHRQMEWESPWGTGFPGWHIECSAMSARYLGDYFDIHCGGEDHIPIHHTNEIAQTEARCGTRLANFWMHGYFLKLDDAKMAKSAGDFLRIDSLRDRGFSPMDYRYFCLTAHYRTQMTFSWESLKANRTALSRLYQAAYDWGEAGEISTEYMDRFVAEINDDLNMPRALAVTWDLVHSGLPAGTRKATLLAFDEILGLDIRSWQPEEVVIPERVKALAEERQKARDTRDWQRADELRDQILESGFVVEDTRQGYRLTTR